MSLLDGLGWGDSVGLFSLAFCIPVSIFLFLGPTREVPGAEASSSAGISVEGNSLKPYLYDTNFPDVFRAVVSSLVTARPSSIVYGGGVLSSLPKTGAPRTDECALRRGSLQARIAEVRGRLRQRSALADCLTVAVERRFVAQELELLRGTSALEFYGPPATAPTLASLGRLLPGNAARQVTAYVTDARGYDQRPGKFDRQQAAQLLMGCIHFGYAAREAHEGGFPPSFQPTRGASWEDMKTEVAWAAASRRAGGFFALKQDAGPAGADAIGFEVLREISVGMVEYPSRTPVEAPPTYETPRGGWTGLPAPDWVHFEAASLEALLTESCLYGWYLWGAEKAAICAIMEALAGQDPQRRGLPPRLREEANALLEPPNKPAWAQR